MNPPVENFSDKLIMFLEVLTTSNSPGKIDHLKCTTLTKDTVILDVMLQNHFKDSLLHDVICEFFSSGGSESIKSTFTMSRTLKEPPSVLKIISQKGTYDMNSGEALKMNLKLLYLQNICTNKLQLMRRYQTS